MRSEACGEDIVDDDDDVDEDVDLHGVLAWPHGESVGDMPVYQENNLFVCFEKIVSVL